MFNFKMLLRKYFEFIEKDYGFFETKDEKLVIPEWLKRGIAYTDNKKVIVFTDDIREKRFETIIYKIQPDLKIPTETEDYYSLEDYLKERNIEFDEKAVNYYSSNIKESIEKTVFYLKEFASELI